MAFMLMIPVVLGLGTELTDPGRLVIPESMATGILENFCAVLLFQKIQNLICNTTDTKAR